MVEVKAWTARSRTHPCCAACRELAAASRPGRTQDGVEYEGFLESPIPRSLRIAERVFRSRAEGQLKLALLLVAGGGWRVTVSERAPSGAKQRRVDLETTSYGDAARRLQALTDEADANGWRRRLF
jgi:hypothetical protein